MAAAAFILRRSSRHLRIWLASLAVCSGSCLATPARAGAWLQEEGRGQVIFNTGLMMSGRRFTRGGRIDADERFVRQDGGASLEYGFRPDVTLLLQTPQKTEYVVQDGEPRRIATTGLGAGARVALWREGGFVLSAQATATTGLERSLPALDRRFGPRNEIDARLLLGYGFEVAGVPGFADVQAGWRWRGGRHADEAKLDLTLGVRPHPKVLVMLQSFNSLAVQGGPPGSGGRMRQHKLQLSAVFDLTETWSVQAGAYAAVAGRSALKEQGALFAVWRKF